MADTKISNLPANTAPIGTDLVPTSDGVTTEKLQLKVLWDTGDDRYISPVFTYGGSGEITRIDYADTSYKLFTYSSGILQTIAFHIFGGAIKLKTFIYSGSTLVQIIDS